ncbi:MAG: hypothetical protein IT328_19995 [Caldilineaceae bacterium]|nr:hypothetical protein [Caldilineaceae bacterium]
MKPRKTYTFSGPLSGWRPELVISTDSITRRHTQSIMVSEPTYDRFARLANSGNYDVEILDVSSGVAWEMRRKPTAN